MNSPIDHKFQLGRDVLIEGVNLLLQTSKNNLSLVNYQLPFEDLTRQNRPKADRGQMENNQ
jgi:hypothetical protein